MYDLKILCPAKINLTLDVVGVRENGYHDVKMIMQAVSLYDELFLTKTKSEDISLRCNLPYVPKDIRNVAFKAAVAFFQHTGIKNEGVFIDVYKKIPVAAGLAGGSTDAAGVIVGLNRLFGASLSTEKMCEIGLSVGADVPFCILGGTALAEGLGEVLTPLEPMPNCFIVLVKPPQGVSTPAVYKAIDEITMKEHPDTSGMISCLWHSDLLGIARRLFNVMEPVSIKLCHEILKIKEMIGSFSPLGVVMSGSGPTVFGIFDNEEKAKECFGHAKQKYAEAYMCKPIKNGAV